MSLLGKPAPTLTLAATGGDATIPGEGPMVVYFYPKDDTPGCTKEAIGFTDAASEFQQLGVSIIGISPDTLAKHEKFRAKHELGIRLASDEDKAAAEAFGVWVEKSMYGKKYMGIDRSTFLIDGDGKVVEEWRKVKVRDHVQTVLTAATELFG
ncbi:MAG: peroxiredoxin [Pseudomonadota bacterium]